MSSAEERKYIRDVLLPEILEDFEGWSKEYQQPRDLGARGEFASLYRKTRKLKTILWDGADSTMWREGLRTIVKEVVSHGLLLLIDLDHNNVAPPTQAPDLQRPIYLRDMTGHGYDGCPICAKVRFEHPEAIV
jgi:hypothetical protein